jgi:anti-sigma factor RsiW
VLKCYRTRQRLSAFLDGALDEATTHSTVAHLTSCDACQKEADQFRRLHALLQRAAAAAPEPDWTGFWPGVVRGVQDAKRAPAARPRRAFWQPRWALGGALAAILMSLGVWQMIPGPTTMDDAGIIVSSARTEDPRGTVMVYSNKEQDVAVVWVLGLDD